MLRLGTFLLLVLFSTSLWAQKDSSSVVVRNHSSKKALIYSTILPGLGQAYNHKYWKMPIIYGAGYLLVSSAFQNGSSYQKYLKAYRQRTDGDSTTIDPYVNLYSTDNLILIKNAYRRNRDLSIIGCVALYALNMIDAYVDAELFEFDVSDDLRASIRPSVIQNGWNCTPQLQFCLQFK